MVTNGNTASPTRLLVGLDGSQLAETVLPLAETLASALGARITLLHVLEQEPPSTIHGEPHLTTLAEAEAYLSTIRATLESSGLTVEAHVHPNPQQDVAASIAAHVAELGVDLIILAAHGHGGFREWLVGRIPQLVAAKARHPVLIVPAPIEREVGVLRRIMVPVDMAGEAAAALPLSRRLASACKAELVLVTVVPTPQTMPGNAGVASVFLPRTAASLLDWTEEEARRNLEQLAGDLGGAGLTASIEVRRGDPAQELLQAIDAHGVDLVVMATHARLGLDGFLAGSVAPRVVSRTLCPTLLVPIDS